MKNQKLFSMLLVFCLFCGQGYATMKLSIVPEGKTMLVCEYTNSASNKVCIPSYFMINENNIICEELFENHRTEPVGPMVDFAVIPKPICLDARRGYTYTEPRDTVDAFSSILEDRYARYWWTLDSQESNSVLLLFSKKGNGSETPNLDLKFLSKGTNVVVALGYLFDLRKGKCESGSVLFLCYNGSESTIKVPHPFGDGSTVEIVPRNTEAHKETLMLKGEETDDYNGKSIEPSKSCEWKCSWADIRKRIPRRMYDMLRRQGFVEMRWRIREKCSEPFPFWIE